MMSHAMFARDCTRVERCSEASAATHNCNRTNRQRSRVCHGFGLEEEPEEHERASTLEAVPGTPWVRSVGVMKLATG